MHPLHRTVLCTVQTGDSMLHGAMITLFLPYRCQKRQELNNKNLDARRGALRQAISRTRHLLTWLP